MGRKSGDVGHAATDMNVSRTVPLECGLFRLIREALTQRVELKPQVFAE
jgi:hypothetical protein